MSEADRILAGIARREALASAATLGPWGWDWDWSVDQPETYLVAGQGASVAATGRTKQGWNDAQHVAANDPTHVLAVSAAAREELTGALAQRDRHETGRDGERWWCTCIAGQPTTVTRCSDAEHADRTIARLLALYGDSVAST